MRHSRSFLARTASVTLIAFCALLVVPRAARADADDEVPPPPPPTVTAQAGPAPSCYAPPCYAPPAYPPAAYPPPGYAPPWTPAPMPEYRLTWQEKPRYGLIAAGISIFGAVYSFNLMGAVLGGEGTLAVPVLGPLLLLGKASSTPVADCACTPEFGCGSCGYDSTSDRALQALLVFDALLQATGMVLLIAGAASKKKVAVYERVVVTPTLAPSFAGLSAVGRF